MRASDDVMDTASRPRSTTLGERMHVRGPNRVEEERRCDVDGCGVKLSTYNPGDACYLHSPVKFRRVRGRVA